ncbi:DUF421 domain-containing protein [Mycobacterium crocinum]|uniref:DUF421 domain-containing protein n=1 Tax=Mycolicibacterium crocinum TaxID=388459 RepID=A0ABY3TJS9_9MYCO|nr:YetF domain-containing protein [Mycolicibacterium crocinum]MCV7218866.1 DUF421 domain-containing protein [Mycolicibacterium crocinum]ULN39525.1 DUF421 domain-containing protein [Mycolicibacterium crocinum]
MIDWAKVFALQTPPLEIVIRGTLMYLALFTLLRVLLKRESGTTGMTDLLVVVLIADAAQNGMAGTYDSVSDGLLLVAVIIGWSFVLDVIAYRWKWAERLIRPRALPLVRDGQMLRRNMRRELVTAEELMGQLRQQGIDDISRVSRAYMESDGEFSFVMASGEPHTQRKPRRQRV